MTEPGGNTAQRCVLMFVKGVTVDIAHALRGMHEECKLSELSAHEGVTRT